MLDELHAPEQRNWSKEGQVGEENWLMMVTTQREQGINKKEKVKRGLTDRKNTDVNKQTGNHKPRSQLKFFLDLMRLMRDWTGRSTEALGSFWKTFSRTAMYSGSFWSWTIPAASELHDRQSKYVRKREPRGRRPRCRRAWHGWGTC